MLLERIRDPQDVQKMSFDELYQLADEIRAFLLKEVSQTGGHLASNLGVVELTIAIHNVFDTSKDRVVFDVGHQSYVHKILTGRKDQFSTLRKYGGLAGFPKPSESIHDAFTAGHSSSSVSTALGIARARTLQNEDYRVLAVIGDGAITGGMFYEAMNDAGASREPLIVILNDNAMSISPNVGGMSQYLSKLRLKPGYFGFKRAWRKFTKQIPGGDKLLNATRKIKNGLHQRLLGTTIFENMGFKYLGPVDGHDIEKMSYLLERAKEANKPVLIHVITKKGKGYAPAEETPSDYHGVGAFDLETGVSGAKKTDFSAVFGETLCEIAKEDPKVCAITAGMPGGTGLDGFAEQFPDRFFDVGIAEEHAVSMAAGMAKQGLTPVFAVYSTFLQRAYDMVQQDISLQNLHVVLCIDRAGLVGADGETHQGVFDVGYLRQIPGLTILSPANFAEFQQMLRKAVREIPGAVAVRYPRGVEGAYREISEHMTLRDGSDLTLVSYGITINAALEAADKLAEQGIHAAVLQLTQLKPLDLTEILDSANRTKRLIVIEETNQPGAVCEAIAETLAETRWDGVLRAVNLGDRYTPHGSPAELQKYAGIDADGIVKTAMEVWKIES